MGIKNHFEVSLLMSQCITHYLKRVCPTVLPYPMEIYLVPNFNDSFMFLLLLWLSNELCQSLMKIHHSRNLLFWRLAVFILG